MSEEWRVELQKEIRELRKARSELEGDVGNINLLSQESEAESDKDQEPLSQGMTRSGVNSSFHEDEENLTWLYFFICCRE